MVSYGLLANVASGEALQVQRQGSIAYVSGGVSLEERERLTRLSDNFNLKVTLAIQEGNYTQNGHSLKF
jgi:hypothetical protein